MIVSQKHKAGVTLMEVMAVVAIMGILSGLGVAGLRSAVANARIKDAAYNVTAFMERTANEARRVNATLCVKTKGTNKIVVYKSASCSSINETQDRFDSLILETPLQAISLNGESISNGVAIFVPRAGLSAAPFDCNIKMQYMGRTDLCGRANKTQAKNSFVPQWNVAEGCPEGSWTDL